MVNYLTLQLNFIASLFYVRRILAFSVTLHFVSFTLQEEVTLTYVRGGYIAGPPTERTL